MTEEERTAIEAIKLEVKENLELCNFSDFEKQILAFRFGLDDGQFRNLEEVATRFSIKPEQIRRLEAQVMRYKWRVCSNKNRRKKLSGYLDMD